MATLPHQWQYCPVNTDPFATAALRVTVFASISGTTFATNSRFASINGTDFATKGGRPATRSLWLSHSQLW
eukprot:578693-Rhodomonas_salina.2